MALMEQYLFKLPDSLVEDMNSRILSESFDDVECIAKADNNKEAPHTHFTFRLGKKSYPASLVPMPCIIETHKTFDNSLFYKSGDISHMLIVYENEAEQAKAESNGIENALQGGLTPPTSNIVRRKYAKTQKSTKFPREDVTRVEEELLKLLPQSGTFPIQEIDEDLVEFQDWMVGPNNKGIEINNEIEFIKRHPEYLLLNKNNSKLNTTMTPTAISKSKDDDAALEDDIFGDL